MSALEAISTDPVVTLVHTVRQRQSAMENLNTFILFHCLRFLSKSEKLRTTRGGNFMVENLTAQSSDK